MRRDYFVTGTDTGVGKTYVGCLIARSLRAAGLRVGVYKPVASGCRRQRDTLVSDDGLALWVPAKMEERYRDRRTTSEVRGTATYSRFRKFQVSTSEELSKDP